MKEILKKILRAKRQFRSARSNSNEKITVNVYYHYELEDLGTQLNESLLRSSPEKTAKKLTDVLNQHFNKHNIWFENKGFNLNYNNYATIPSLENGKKKILQN